MLVVWIVVELVVVVNVVLKLVCLTRKLWSESEALGEGEGEKRKAQIETLPSCIGQANALT